MKCYMHDTKERPCHWGIPVWNFKIWNGKIFDALFEGNCQEKKKKTSRVRKET